MVDNSTPSTASEQRLLFVVSKDYGELCWAMTFLQGQQFSQQSMLLLPEQIYAGNKDSLPVDASPYSNAEHVLACVESYKPTVVFLLSGYLFSNDDLIPRPELEQLVAKLRNKVGAIVTSDPFCGMASRLTNADINNKYALLEQTPIKRVLFGLILRFKTIENFLRIPCLENLPHIYATSTPPEDENDTAARISFFNPCILEPPTTSPDEPEKRWLFVLSSTDFTCQIATKGKRKFVRNVIRMLRQAIASGRKATFLAPASLIEILAKEFPDCADIELLVFCPYTEFVPRLFEAEYVFYWNVFSFSLLLRMANELPLFFFDSGHLSHTIKPYYDFGLSTHFGKWTPTYLTLKDPLDPAALAALAEKQKPALQALRDYWQASPTPVQVIDQLTSSAEQQSPQ